MVGRNRACLTAMNTLGIGSGWKCLRQVLGSRAYLVVAWGCLLPFVISRAENEALPLVGSITTPKPGPKGADNQVLPKTIFSSNLRMSILVGLEGSGHHYLIQAVTDMFHSNDEISVGTTPCIETAPYLTPATMETSPLAYTNASQRASDQMHDVALREKKLPWPGHLVRLCREESYPTGYGSSKALHYIDLPMLASTAEAEGVDLRVVYLKRSAHDILVANTIHRSFQKRLGSDMANTLPGEQYSKYALVLLTDATVMHSFLAEIDPAFIVCHDYGHAGEEKQAAKIANFVSPNAVIAEMYNSSLLRTWKERPSEREGFPFEGSEAVVARLQRELDAFEYSYCG